MVLEAGVRVGAAIGQWGHTRLFSPWRYNIDAAAARLLEGSGWSTPDADTLPTGTELVEQYLEPLTTNLALADRIRTGCRLVSVSRAGMDKTRTAGRASTPFLVRLQNTEGAIQDHLARAVIDASGTWENPNPLGQSGLEAPGETEAREAGHITAPLPEINGRDRARFARRHVLLVGAGHSAANTLLELTGSADCC